jgi:hypothetical protein
LPIWRALGGGLRRGSADAEAAGSRFQLVGVLLAPEGEEGGCDEPERHEPEEDPERDTARDQAASQLALVLQHLANQRRAGQLLAAGTDRIHPFGPRRRPRLTLGAHPRTMRKPARIAAKRSVRSACSDAVVGTRSPCHLRSELARRRASRRETGSSTCSSGMSSRRPR